MPTLYARHASPLGPLTLTSDGHALTGLWLPHDRLLPTRRATLPHTAPATSVDALPVFAAARAWLDAYFGGQKPAFPPATALPLKPGGTPFQQAVYALLCAIPYGTCVTYGALARELARQRGVPRMSAQAVGGAVGRNPIAIIIPCHRVMGAGGQLTGYGGGIDAKIALLALEGVDTRNMRRPRRGAFA